MIGSQIGSVAGQQITTHITSYCVVSMQQLQPEAVLYSYANGFHQFSDDTEGIEKNVQPMRDLLQPYFQPNFDLKLHQYAALQWIQEKEAQQVNGIFADGPGLGKTVTVLSLILHDHIIGKAIGPTLIICPNPVLLLQWRDEFHQRFQFLEHADSNKKHQYSIHIYEGLPPNTTDLDIIQSTIQKLNSQSITLISMSVSRPPPFPRSFSSLSSLATATNT